MIMVSRIWNGADTPQIENANMTRQHIEQGCPDAQSDNFGLGALHVLESSR